MAGKEPHIKKTLGTIDRDTTERDTTKRDTDNTIERDGRSAKGLSYIKGDRKPTTLLNPPFSYLRQDSGVSEGNGLSLASTLSSITSTDSGLGSSTASTPMSSYYRTLPDTLEEESAAVFGIYSMDEVDTPSKELPSEEVSLSTSSQEEIHDKTVTDDELTPTNSPKSSVILIPTITHSHYNEDSNTDTIDNTTMAHSQYENHINMFFHLFVKDLCLREDTVYPAFNVQHVTALGFGIKNDRIIPCIRVYSDLFSYNDEDDKKLHLLSEVAQHITTAVRSNVHVELTQKECLEFLEIDEAKSAILFPEEPMGAPGDQFKVPGAALRGTIGYFMKGELTVTTDDGSLTCMKHFGVTCAHCALPLRNIWSIVDDACKDDRVTTDYKHCPVQTLHNYMWPHSCHNTHMPLFSSSRGNHGVAEYEEFSKKEGECFIKASICSEGMRSLVRKEVTYKDCTRDDSASSYDYVLSKFGMIPSGFSMPLPMYLFSYHRNDIYRIPFNVDIGILEVKGLGVAHDHCLETTLTTYCSLTVNGVITEGTLQGNHYAKYANNIPLIVNPTSGAVHTPIPSPEVSILNDKQNLLLEDTSTADYTAASSTGYNAASSTGYNAASAHYNATGLSSGALSTGTNADYNAASSTGASFTDDDSALYSADKKKPKPIHKVVLKKVSKTIKTAIASGRNIFNYREQNELHLHVLSHHQSDHERQVIRSLKVNNNQFCIEFIHRNPHKRNQYRSFPAVKWNWKNKGEANDFIIPGDSGSSLFLTNKDSNGEKQQVLLGVVCSANTASRVDFVKEVIAPDLFLYMSSLLLSDDRCTQSMTEICTKIQRQVRIADQLRQDGHVQTSAQGREMCDRIKANHQLMKEMETPYTVNTNLLLPIINRRTTSCSGTITFKLTECIKDCATVS